MAQSSWSFGTRKLLSRVSRRSRDAFMMAVKSKPVILKTAFTSLTFSQNRQQHQNMKKKPNINLKK